MRRAEKQITDAKEIESILREQKVLRLAMCDGDRPYVVPLSYGYDGMSFFIHSAKQGRKIDVLRNNPHVCFEIDCDYVPTSVEDACKRSTRYRSVIGAGEAALIDEKDAKLAGLDIIMGQHYGPGDRSYDMEKVDRLLIIKIEVRSLSAKRSG